ncbi:hypothetical protein MMC12_006279 [Toensbergia leucococca]|nr:hypothetical protein [Toensbergia leucococca]
MLSSLIFSLLAALITAAPTESGLRFDKRAGSLPTLTLPYGTWQAASFDENGQIYTFKNIRFAAPPVGELRWALPAEPEHNATLQDGSYGPVCVQAPLKGVDLVGPGDESAIGAAANQLFGGLTSLKPSPPSSEDCLFLDIYVPAKAVNDPSLRLPVVHWIYGGAYIFGSKDSTEPLLYSGIGLIQESGGNVIFVASNYRVGAYGFLAGTTMEKEGHPNVGLYDQRAAFQWIQDYIDLLGGDPNQVSAWGESAGAGSIMHHLVAFGGTEDPLFTKAILQSPAFEFQFDRKGLLEQTFQNFSALAGCTGQGVACLRTASAETLATANTALCEAAPDGTFAVGPAADGDMIRQLAVLEFASGHYWNKLDSIIISHVLREPDLFVDGHIQTDAEFNSFVNLVFPPYAQAAGVNALIEQQYPPVMSGTNHTYATETDRVKALVQGSSFVCNVRYLSDAYAGKNYNLQYSITPAYHATDLLATFYNVNLDLTVRNQSISVPLIPGFGSFAQTYQSYLTSHARSGDPNTYSRKNNLPPAINWPLVGNSGDEFTGVLNAGDLGFSLISDPEDTKSVCGFWEQIASAATNLGGYAPPDAVVETTILPVGNDPSANYCSINC